VTGALTDLASGIAPARPLVIASRRSALALAQTGQIRARVEERFGVRVTVVEVTSQGDIDPRALTSIGGVGVFVSAIRASLDSGEADIAVHSLKDLPTAPDPKVRLAAVPPREDPADVLVAAGSASLDELPRGARVGTGSPRRAAQLAALRPDLEIVAVRGNVDTRIAKVRSGELTAVVLARAGLARLGRLAEISHEFGPREMLPAPGQGALAIECRAEDAELADRLGAAFDDPLTRTCVAAERALLATLEAGCNVPVGALAHVDGDRLVLEAVVGRSLRGSAFRPYQAGRDEVAMELGGALARDLLDRGAADALTDHTGASSTGDRMGTQ
jgi:hydroxymethylbilane synthase